MGKERKKETHRGRMSGKERERDLHTERQRHRVREIEREKIKIFAYEIKYYL